MKKLQKTSGTALWERAKAVIPGGNQLLSKRSEMFLPNFWPSYFSRAKGVSVWDLDDCQFTDMCLMGVGTSTLGFGCDVVDDAVAATVQAGNMSTLNCPEEVRLAERLVALHDWADMVRFARSGGEANAISIRIARAASGRGNVAFCGYHGWHDWYLSANIGVGGQLDGHLLPGLEPNGVARSLGGTAFPFNYGDIETLRDLVKKQNIGVIKMEVVRNRQPEDGFLQAVRDLATEFGAVLVFDECTSGFRESFGGIHLLYGVEPDIAVFGKALGNGYALTAVIGRRSVMEAAQTSFISSTFWTERIGPTASLACLDEMERVQSWQTLPAVGRKMKDIWKKTAKAHFLDVIVQGIDAIPSFYMQNENWLFYKTLISQELLKRHILASNVFYASVAHGDADFNKYADALDSVFALIKQCEDGRDVQGLLDGPVCHNSFKRIN